MSTRIYWIVSLLVVVVMATVGVWQYQTNSLVTWEGAGSGEQMNAIFVFAGQTSRIDYAVALAEKGVSETVVLSAPPGNISDNQNCGLHKKRNFRVVCVAPEPENTHGEGRMFAAYAKENNLSNVLLVTSEGHARRAFHHFDNCWNGKTAVVTVEGGTGHGERKETLKALFLRLTGAC